MTAEEVDEFLLYAEARYTKSGVNPMLQADWYLEGFKGHIRPEKEK